MIESLINQIAEKILPSSGSNLDGFTQDLDYAFWKSKAVLYPYKISRAGDPHRLVTVKAHIVDRVPDLQVVFDALATVWAHVRYRHFEASGYEYYKEAAVFRFVTVMRSELLFVSGAFILEGDQYHRLISEHQQKFDKTHGSLSSMPLGFRR
jgi:hypothetical protein